MHAPGPGHATGLAHMPGSVRAPAPQWALLDVFSKACSCAIVGMCRVLSEGHKFVSHTV